jgi:hypothetical protein
MNDKYPNVYEVTVRIAKDVTILVSAYDGEDVVGQVLDIAADDYDVMFCPPGETVYVSAEGNRVDKVTNWTKKEDWPNV